LIFRSFIGSYREFGTTGVRYILLVLVFSHISFNSHQDDLSPVSVMSAGGGG